ncbi:hypothetical protein [Psychrobium sp. 1_MG-2023]|uniref:hypothetical protein n=1 Tax=Psychrobium sp. 1_MG-2023 TaxID=3062624 RepID=UPI000C32703B|nr:hypothetical protein [Psychrobium sp. 1_MG-2023]MDP2560669.1 hypothetical protein [Psychrobium sp. 1_MG-2023]PKF56565.1 hypothetical protein CW748_08755 [Alteromonadales bacterium alter-6D02]
MKYIIKVMMILCVSVMVSQVALAHNSGERRQDNRQEARYDHRDVKHRAIPHRGHKVIVAPRHRSFRNIVIIRPHGHAYIGYGHYHTDNDAWKWLTFTAITLKLLDNLNEQAQREHEAAQITATNAKVGEKIDWHTKDSSGYVMTTKEGTNSAGLTCREFQQQIIVGGKTESAYGTACLQADGSWKMT